MFELVPTGSISYGFATGVYAPGFGNPVDATTVVTGSQVLTNRTEWLFSQSVDIHPDRSGWSSLYLEKGSAALQNVDSSTLATGSITLGPLGDFALLAQANGTINALGLTVAASLDAVVSAADHLTLEGFITNVDATSALTLSGSAVTVGSTTTIDINGGSLTTNCPITAFEAATSVVTVAPVIEFDAATQVNIGTGLISITESSTEISATDLTIDATNFTVDAPTIEMLGGPITMNTNIGSPSTAPAANTIYADQISKAWGYIHIPGSSAAPVMFGGHNMTASIIAGGAELLCSFPTHMGDANYEMQVTITDPNNNWWCAPQIVSKNVTGSAICLNLINTTTLGYTIYVGALNFNTLAIGGYASPTDAFYLNVDVKGIQ